jgi:Protein of unknown function (DUF3253)
MPTRRAGSTPDGPDEDEHHFVVNGRRWRRTDPGIPEQLREQLVAELMSARRAVQVAPDDEARRAARRRVQDAKVALGERGEPWWEPSSEAGRADRAAATARALLRHRRPGATICPSEVARTIGAEQWRRCSAEVRDLVLAMAERHELEVRQKGERVDPDPPPRGPIRLALPDAPEASAT